ncbi:nucleoside hydrolase [Corynebacterium frankenforstense]
MLIDCDTGIDDALALVYLAGLHVAGEIALAGVSATAGNTTAHQAAANSAWILRLCGLGAIPVVAGLEAPEHVELTTTPDTHGPTGTGYLRAEVDPQRLPAGPQALTGLWGQARADRLIVTGPATDAAFRLRCGARLPRTTLMGGAYDYPGNTTPFAEWNSWVDPHAAAELFDSGTPVTVCSLAVTERFTVDPDFLGRLIEALGQVPVARCLPEMLRWYFEFHRAVGEGYLAQIHDAVTCMIALDTVGFTGTPARVHVDAEGEHRGCTTADRSGNATATGATSASNALIVDDVDVAGARAELLRSAEALAGFLR